MFYNDSKLLKWASGFLKVLSAACKDVGLYDFLPHYSFFSHAAVLICDLFNHELCNNFLVHVMNKDPTTDYQERWDVYASNEPSGASTQDFWHYA